MVIKIYISGISGNKEVKKRQQRVLMILDSKTIKYDVIDITEPGREADKDFMQNNSKSNGGTVSDPNPRSPLPPQIFNDEAYCGDYDQFDLANEIDTLEQFLKVEAPPEETPAPETEPEKVVNGNVEKQNEEGELKENSQETGNGDKADLNEEIAVKEKTPSREPTPAVRVASKEPSPAKEDKKEQPSEKEDSPSKEATPERQKSLDKDEVVPTEKESSLVKETELESKKSSKENTPEKDESVNENGTVSSREQSQEKEATEEVVGSKKDNPSEALIASEQAASAE